MENHSFMEKANHSTDALLRKQELESYQIFGTEPEAQLDEIVTLAAKLCDVPIALISFNDGNHHWFKARYGFDEKEIYLENSISSKAIQQPDEIFEIFDLSADERFQDHPMLQSERNTRFCASVPLISDNGFVLGNLILIDTASKHLTDHQRDILRILGRQIMHLLNLRRKRLLLENSQQKIEDQNTLLISTLKELNDYKTALDSSSIVAITDTKGTILFANDTFCEISGYSRDELIGQNHRIVNSGYHTSEFWKKMWLTIGNGNIWREEVRNQTKGGDYYWVETTIVPFIDEVTKKPIKYLSIRQDITEQKNIQQAEMQSLLYAQEVDRDQFAEDLHEGLAQRLVAIRLSLQMLESKLKGHISPGTVSNFDFISEQLKEAIDETKNLAVELMPRSMMHDGIISSLSNYLARIQSKYRVECELESNFRSIQSTSKNLEITLYRVTVSIIEKAILSKVIESIHVNIVSEPHIKVQIIIQSTPLLGNNFAKPLSSYLGFMGQLKRRIELSGGQLMIQDSTDNSTTEIVIQFE